MLALTLVAQILLVVGGFNWGLVGLFQIDLVAELFGGEAAPVARLIYVLIGLAAIYGLYLVKPLIEDRTHNTTLGSIRHALRDR